MAEVRQPPKSAAISLANWRGDFDASKIYYRDDLLRYSGLVWRVLTVEVTGVAPPALADTPSSTFEFVARASLAGDKMTGAEIVAAINAELGSTNWQGGGGGNLSTTRNATSATITPSGGGTAAVIPAADAVNAGVMTAADKVKLDGIAPGADVNVGTDLSITARGTTTLDIASSTGLDATVPAATQLLTGLMTAADKTKLDGIQAGAQANVPTNLSILNRGVSTLDIASDTGLDATVPAATTALTGLMSAADKTKLDGMVTSASGNRWGVIPFVDGSGVMEIGKYIDAHNAAADTSDFTTRLDFTSAGNVVQSGPAATNIQYVLDAAAGLSRNIRFRTAGVDRWSINTTTVAETGFNAGANFVIVNYNDAGANISVPFSIDRATGVVTMNDGISINGGIGLFVSPAGADLDVGIAGPQDGLEVHQPTFGADALMAFHVSGDFAAYFGLDGGLNDLVWGGWSLGATTKRRVMHTGNFSNTAIAEALGGAPNADRILFWDASAGGLTWLSLDSTLTITGTTLSAAGGGGPAAATQADQETATSTTTYVSPGRQQFHPSAAKAWVRFNSAGTVAASYNITNITDNGVGDWSVNIGTDFSSVNYCGIAFSGRGAAVTTDYSMACDAAPTAGIFHINRVTGGIAADPSTVNAIFAAFFGDQ